MIKLLQILFELSLAGVGLIFVYSQVLRPAFRGTPVFPMFRKRPQTEREIERVNETIEEKEQERYLKQRRRKAGIDKK